MLPPAASRLLKKRDGRPIPAKASNGAPSSAAADVADPAITERRQRADHFIQHGSDERQPSFELQIVPLAIAPVARRPRARVDGPAVLGHRALHGLARRFFVAQLGARPGHGGHSFS